MKFFRPMLVCVAAVALVSPVLPATAGVVESTPESPASFNGTVRAIAVKGSTIYVGGRFTRATDNGATTVRRHLAAVSAVTGELLPWNPGANGNVNSLAVFRKRVFVGGSFSKAGGRSVTQLARISTSTGKADKRFRPQIDREVHAIAVTKKRVYVGGSFREVDGKKRSRLAALGRTDAALTNWRPRANRRVEVLRRKGGVVFAGGAFNKINGRTDVGHLSALRLKSGKIAPGFRGNVSNRVFDLRVTRTRVYAAVGGIGGRVEAIDRSGAELWSRKFDGDVQAVTLLDGLIYVGGHFGYLCATPAVAASNGDCLEGQTFTPKLAALRANGDRVGWTPQPDSALGVVALARATRKLVVGGDFEHFKGGSVTQPKFALFRK